MRAYTLIRLFVFLLISTQLSAQLPVRYEVSLDQIRQHELVITVEFTALPPQPLEIIMPSSSPGRYAIHLFAKNVYAERAFDKSGNPLTVRKTDLSRWEVADHDGYVKFEYTLFANHGDGTYSGVDNRKLHLNMPSAFVFAPVAERRPIELHFDLDAHPDWSIASQMQSLDKETIWAPDYYYFFDSPTLVGDIDYRSFETTSNGNSYTIEVAAMHEGTDAELDAYTEWIKQIVEEQKEIYGALPNFDYGRYTFLLSYNPWIYGDGMEHRNSTVCSSRGNLANNARQLIGTISHEFFHAWNVERLRPKSLEPFSFQHTNMSNELWFAEGFTSYYDDLVLRRTGIFNDTLYLAGLTGTLNYVLNSPGRQFYGPVGMSQRAPFVDAATSIDEHNTANIFVSYYPYGAVVALALDLSLRKQFENVTLDDYMQYLWEHYGRSEIPYQIPDLQHALAVVCGDAAFAEQFFRDNIYNSQLPDFATLFEPMGFDFRLLRPGQSDLAGLSVDVTEEGATVRGNITKAHSLYKAGVQSGDVLKALNGLPLTSPTQWDSLVQDLTLDQTYSVDFLQNGLLETGNFKLKQNPVITVVPIDAPSEEQLRRRRQWLED